LANGCVAFEPKRDSGAYAAAGAALCFERRPDLLVLL
jgi:hypothetical protein